MDKDEKPIEIRAVYEKKILFGNTVALLIHRLKCSPDAESAKIYSEELRKWMHEKYE